MTYTHFYSSPIGKLFIVANKDSLLRLDFENSRYIQKHDTNIAQDISKSNSFILQETKRWLDNYFGGKVNSSIPSIKLEGTPFRVLVWNLLLNIPYGKTVSYGELSTLVAEKRGVKKIAAQAIGQAVGKNPISIIVPCHRVIAKNGLLTGYGGGLERKRFLLELEKGVLNI